MDDRESTTGKADLQKLRVKAAVRQHEIVVDRLIARFSYVERELNDIIDSLPVRVETEHQAQ